MKNEYGRSMIEMLGVLAIIGVLSIGGLAGYTMAMNRYRANEIMDYASRCAVIAQTNNITGAIAAGDCEDDGILGADSAPLDLAFAITAADAAATTMDVTAQTVPDAVADILVARSGQGNVTIADNAGVVTFTFQK